MAGLKPYLPVLKHTAVAFGGAAAALLATVQVSGHWGQAEFIIAGQALLAGLGIGYAKRQAA